jgi:hypothetical protein
MPVRDIPLPERERVGYSVNYVVPRAVKSVEWTPWWRLTRTEARLGSLTFWGGFAWAVQIATKDLANWIRLMLTPGPLEVSAVGLLIWLHAKWRRSVRVD